MTRAIQKLSAKAVENFEKDVSTGKAGGKLSDGGGLYLVTNKSGTLSWAFIYTNSKGKRREAGLGLLRDVGLAKARTLASAMRDQLTNGIDPLEAKRIERQQGVTFKECADSAKAVLEVRWRNVEVEGIKWDRAITGCKVINSMPVKGIGIEDIRDVLKQYDDRVSQKVFVLSVIRRVLDVAVARGLRADNPAIARIVGKVTSLERKVRHHRSLSYKDVPAFVKELQAKDAIVARCLEFIILTGVRKSEATGARWDEFDFATSVWTIPASRMKGKRQHSVPLTDRVISILNAQRGELTGGVPVQRGNEGETSNRTVNDKHTSRVNVENHGFVFPGGVRGQSHLSHGGFMHHLPQGITVHGFRSALREYLGDETNVSYETAEEVLAHRVGDSTVSAYRRSSGIAKKRAALTYWHDYVLQLNVKGDEKSEHNQMDEVA
jgi:integrase